MLPAMRFIHTADWQIGKPFRKFGDQEPVLRQARLAAVETIGKLAVAEGVQLLAGHRSIQTTQGYIEGDGIAQVKLMRLL